jgi:hypothetical protein
MSSSVFDKWNEDYQQKAADFADLILTKCIAQAFLAPPCVVLG